MNRKVLIAECSHGYWLDVVTKLITDYNWSPVYWVQSKRYHNLEELENRFPNTMFHDNYEAVKGIPIACYFNNIFPVPDSDLIERFRNVEATTLKMMDRMDPLGVFSYQDRIKLYYNYLSYWDFILKEHQPDVYLTSVSPHLCYDNVLYELCKYHNIPTILLKNTVISGKIFITSDFTKEYIHIKSNIETPKITKTSKNYLEKVRKTYKEAIPNYMVSQMNKKKDRELDSSGINSLLKKPIRLLRNIKHNYITKWYKEEVSAYFKMEGKNITEKITRKELSNYYDKVRIKTKKLESNYRKICWNKIEMDKPFIYVALMYQPERTSCPEGGIFVNQYLMIQWLSEMMPSNYHIIVKEHPSQFLMDNIQTRESWFYDEVNKLPNVNFISINYDSFALIDKSIAVSTLTGTVGFESYCRLKPVFCFGYAWYRGAKGIYSINTKSDLKNAINSLKDGVNEKNVERFLYELEHTAIDGYINESQKLEIKNGNAVSLANAIENFYITDLKEK